MFAVLLVIEMNWRLTALVLGLLAIAAVFLSGSIAYQFNLSHYETKFDATCTTPGAPAQQLPVYGGYIYQRTGAGTFRAVFAYLVDPNIQPGSGYYYSPSQSGIIYDADNTPVAIITGGVS